MSIQTSNNKINSLQGLRVIAFLGVFLTHSEIKEFGPLGIQSVSIYNWNEDETYKTGNDAVITTEPENIFLFYPVTDPDTDAAYNSAFRWSLTDSKGNPSDAAILTLEKGLLILTAVRSGNCTLTLKSKVKPELSCSVAIEIKEPAAD